MLTSWFYRTHSAVVIAISLFFTPLCVSAQCDALERSIQRCRAGESRRREDCEDRCDARRRARETQIDRAGLALGRRYRARSIGSNALNRQGQVLAERRQMYREEAHRCNEHCGEVATVRCRRLVLTRDRCQERASNTANRNSPERVDASTIDSDSDNSTCTQSHYSIVDYGPSMSLTGVLRAGTGRGRSGSFPYAYVELPHPICLRNVRDPDDSSIYDVDGVRRIQLEPPAGVEPGQSHTLTGGQFMLPITPNIVERLFWYR